MADFWFGNLRRAGYFPAPNSGMDADSIGVSDQMDFANGGAYVAQSAGTHREFNLSWGVQEKSVMNFLKDYRNGVHGTGLLYMVDPFAANALPPHWANPGLTCEGWPSLVGPSVKPVRAAPVTVTNVVTNPSFEATGATTTVRINVVPDPAGTNVARATKWDGGGGATTTLQSLGNAVPEMPSNKAFRMTFTTASSNSAGGVGHNGTIPVAAGQVYTFSLHARAANSQSLGVEVKFFDSGGATISTVTGAKQQVPFQTAARLSTSATAPAGAVNAQLLAVSAAGGVAWPINSWLEATAFLVEASPVLGDYFDGTTAPVSDFSFAWAGTANASSSVQTGVAAFGYSYNRVAGISSTAWAAAGARSMRQIPTSTTSFDNYTDIPVAPLGLKPSTKYTFLATVYIPAAITGNTQGNSRSLFVYLANATLVSGSTPGAQAPNVAGTYNLRATFTTPAAFTGTNSIRLYHGGQTGSGELYWDKVGIVEGDYKGPFFDGSTEFLDGTKGAWTGAPDASTSTLARTPGGMPNTGAQYTLTGEVGAVPSRKLQLLVPQDRDLWLGFSGVATNGAVLRMRGITRDGAYGPVSDVPLLDPSDSIRLNTKVSGTQYSAIQLYMTTTVPGTATITLVSGKAVYSLQSDSPVLTGDHVEGDGHTGFRLGDISTAYIQAADGHQYVTTATKATEIEAWI